jgi:hypothetical protein
MNGPNWNKASIKRVSIFVLYVVQAGTEQATQTLLLCIWSLS